MPLSPELAEWIGLNRENLEGAAWGIHMHADSARDEFKDLDPSLHLSAGHLLERLECGRDYMAKAEARLAGIAPVLREMERMLEREEKWREQPFQPYLPQAMENRAAEPQRRMPKLAHIGDKRWLFTIPRHGMFPGMGAFVQGYDVRLHGIRFRIADMQEDGQGWLVHLDRSDFQDDSVEWEWPPESYKEAGRK